MLLMKFWTFGIYKVSAGSARISSFKAKQFYFGKWEGHFCDGKDLAVRKNRPAAAHRGQPLPETWRPPSVAMSTPLPGQRV
jgi:hypothetical protein